MGDALGTPRRPPTRVGGVLKFVCVYVLVTQGIQDGNKRVLILGVTTQRHGVNVKV